MMFVICNFSYCIIFSKSVLNDNLWSTEENEVSKCKWKRSLNVRVLRVPGPISQNENIYSNDASSPKKFWFQIWVKSFKLFGNKKRLLILQLPNAYTLLCSIIMVTITSHIFINISQTVHFSAIKFTKGNEKNMSFFLIVKISESLRIIWSNWTGLL